MRTLQLMFVLFAIAACGGTTNKNEENPTTCAVRQLPEGTEFTCTDKNGNVTTGINYHGKEGAQGVPGEVGPKGEGLKPASLISCKGSIEGWLENSSYEVDFQKAKFETGDQFLSATTKLRRGDEVLNQRTASAFFISSATELVIYDGQFSLTYDGQALVVKSQGGVSATLPCQEVK